jgi:hypothetical protein
VNVDRRSGDSEVEAVVERAGLPLTAESLSRLRSGLEARLAGDLELVASAVTTRRPNGRRWIATGLAAAAAIGIVATIAAQSTSDSGKSAVAEQQDEPARSIDDLVGARWLLVRDDGATESSVNFSIAASEPAVGGWEVIGTDGCNSLRGPIEYLNGQLLPGSIETSAVFCDDQIPAVLPLGDPLRVEWSLTGKEIVLVQPDESSSRFRREGSPPEQVQVSEGGPPNSIPPAGDLLGGWILADGSQIEFVLNQRLTARRCQVGFEQQELPLFCSAVLTGEAGEVGRLLEEASTAVGLDGESLVVSGDGTTHTLTRRPPLRREIAEQYVAIWAITVSDYGAEGVARNVGDEPITAWMGVDYGDGLPFVRGFDGCRRYPAMVLDIDETGGHLADLGTPGSCPGLAFEGSIFDDVRLDPPGDATVLRRSDGFVIKMIRFSSEPQDLFAQPWTLSNTEATVTFDETSFTVGDCVLPMTIDPQATTMSVLLDETFVQTLESCELGSAAGPVRAMVKVLAGGAERRGGVDGHMLLWAGEDEAIILRASS